MYICALPERSPLGNKRFLNSAPREPQTDYSMTMDSSCSSQSSWLDKSEQLLIRKPDLNENAEKLNLSQETDKPEARAEPPTPPSEKKQPQFIHLSTVLSSSELLSSIVQNSDILEFDDIFESEPMEKKERRKNRKKRRRKRKREEKEGKEESTKT